MSAGSVSFDGNNLQTASIITQSISGHDSMPVIAANVYPLAHSNRSSIPFISFPNKPITISGVINGSSIADCDNKVDIFKSYFTGKDKNLDLGYNGTTRRYTATAIKVDVPRPGGLTYAEFTVSFMATVPFGQDPASTTALAATGRTLGTYSDPFTFTGSAPQQQPIFTITVTAFTGSGAQSISVGNSATGQLLTVNRTWVAGDVLTIDPTNTTKPVQVNGNAVDFSGALPTFAPGSGTLTYNDTFTTRTFNETVIFYGAYV